MNLGISSISRHWTIEYLVYDTIRCTKICQPDCHVNDICTTTITITITFNFQIIDYDSFIPPTQSAEIFSVRALCIDSVTAFEVHLELL